MPILLGVAVFAKKRRTEMTEVNQAALWDRIRQEVLQLVNEPSMATFLQLCLRSQMLCGRFSPRYH